MMEKKVNDVTNQNHQPAPFGPGAQGRMLGAPGAINAGAVSIEQERAIAEAQGQLVLAKRFPRDLTSAHAELMMACKSKAFAGVAFYAKPQGGGTVTGPSIRMAEEVARVFGNFQYGHRELSRDNKKSEVEIFAWDMEKNNYSKRQITVMHVVDTREGPKPMRDQTQIDQKINNVSSKQARGLILALMPKWLVEDAVQECRKTLAGNNDEPLEVRVRRMTGAFAKYGVTTEHLEKYLDHKLDATLLDELVDLQGIFNSLRDGTPASEIFGKKDKEEDGEPASSLAETAKAGAVAKAASRAAAPAVTAGEVLNAVLPDALKTEIQPQAAAAPVQQEKPARRQKTAAEPASAAAAPAEDPQPSAPAEAPQPAAIEQAAAGHIADAEDIF
jgi:hypothetical protein